MFWIFQKITLLGSISVDIGGKKVDAHLTLQIKIAASGMDKMFQSHSPKSAIVNFCKFLV